jgi:hypothetical protein
MIMNIHSKITLARTAVLIMAFLMTVQGQGVSRRPATAPQSKPTQKKTADPQEKWWQAQQSIEAAIQQLEAYLRAYPNGQRAESARQQLQVLQSLTATAAKPEWARLFLGAAVMADWRVASVDPQPDKTRVTLEIRCAQDFNGECGFPAFDGTNPLVLLDTAGRYYPMLEAGDVPEGVRRTDAFQGAQYRFQPGRTITVEVIFAPLARGAVSGQVQYRERNAAIPAKFSLARQR